MALQDLNRAGDTPIPTYKLADIAPVNWHRFPPAIQPSNPINVPTVSFNGGAGGDDVDQATANATDVYTPRTQAAKAAAMGTTLAVDIGRARGAIEPDDPYPTAASPAPAAPVITTLTPNTAVAGSPALTCVITGTGFTPWSTVETGNVQTDYVRYISPTEIRVGIDARRSVAGTISVVVRDHNVRSASKPFTFT